MRKCLYLLLVYALPMVAIGEELGDIYFTGKNPVLTPQEKESIAIVERWKEASANSTQPAMGQNGAINFLFGASQPSLVCAVMQVCDVQLQPGEQVNSIHLGDTVRWTVEPAITGFGPDEIQHLIIKVRDVGLETSLVVTTDRRTYSFRLRSHRNKFMPHVTFTYPDEAIAKWEALKARQTSERQRATMPDSGEYLGNLSFGYDIDGDDVRWKPVRVYNDGSKTIIQMPSTLSQTEAPTLLVIRGENEPEEVIVNYRLQRDRYIVDSVFDKAILVAGVGRNQDRITITRKSQ